MTALQKISKLFFFLIFFSVSSWIYGCNSGGKEPGTEDDSSPVPEENITVKKNNKTQGEIPADNETTAEKVQPDTTAINEDREPENEITAEAGGIIKKDTIIASADTSITDSTGITAETDTLSTAEIDSGAILTDTLSREVFQKQQELAFKLFDEISNTPREETQKLKKIYKQIINECPATKEAQISYRKLADLYMFSGSEPDYSAVINLLQDFPVKYPRSQYLLLNVATLVRAYEETYQWEPIVELYEKLFRKKIAMSDSEFINHGFSFAQALENVGRKEDALTWYRKILEKDKGRGNNFKITLAKQRIEELSTD